MKRAQYSNPQMPRRRLDYNNILHMWRGTPSHFHCGTCEYRWALEQLCPRSISNANLPSNSASPMPMADAMWHVTLCNAMQSSKARCARRPERGQEHARNRHCNLRHPSSNVVPDVALQRSNVSTYENLAKWPVAPPSRRQLQRSIGKSDAMA